MTPTKQGDFTILKNNQRAARTFWTLNTEMNPRNKVTFVREVKLASVDRYRQSVLARTGQKVSYTSVMVKLAAMVITEHPLANRAIIGPWFFRRLIQFTTTDITVAVEREVPGAEAVVLAETLRDCKSKTPAEISGALAALTEKDLAKNERWQLFNTILTKVPTFLARWILAIPRYFPSQWVKHRGSSCFVNSPAKYGVDLIVADMIWPLTFSFGWARDRAVVGEDGAVKAEKTIPLVMIFDRRIMAGAPAARIFSRAADILENFSEEMAAFEGKHSARKPSTYVQPTDEPAPLN